MSGTFWSIEEVQRIVAEKDEVIADLKTRIDRWNHSGNYIGTNAAIKKQKAEIEKFSKDAERYQWLRQHHVSWSTDGLVLIDGGRGFDLDRLIDAAMAETGEPK